MRTSHYSIAGLMGTVLIAMLGLTTLRHLTETRAEMAILVTCGVFTLAIVGAVYGGKTERIWWLVFALCGWVSEVAAVAHVNPP